MVWEEEVTGRQRTSHGIAYLGGAVGFRVGIGARMDKPNQNPYPNPSPNLSSNPTQTLTCQRHTFPASGSMSGSKSGLLLGQGSALVSSFGLGFGWANPNSMQTKTKTRDQGEWQPVNGGKVKKGKWVGVRGDWFLELLKCCIIPGMSCSKIALLLGWVFPRIALFPSYRVPRLAYGRVDTFFLSQMACG